MPLDTSIEAPTIQVAPRLLSTHYHRNRLIRGRRSLRVNRRRNDLDHLLCCRACQPLCGDLASGHQICATQQVLDHVGWCLSDKGLYRYIRAALDLTRSVLPPCLGTDRHLPLPPASYRTSFRIERLFTPLFKSKFGSSTYNHAPTHQNPSKIDHWTAKMLFTYPCRRCRMSVCS